MKIYINGRFLTQKVTGVQRVAHEIVKQLDNLEASMEIILLVPRNTLQDIEVDFQNIKIKEIGFLKGHLWEQLELPLYTLNNLLINFCNTAPLFKKNQIVYIHDAAVYSRPTGYSKNFVRWYKLLYLSTSKFSKRIITVSDFSKDDLVKHLPNLKDKITVSHIAVDHMDKVAFDDSILSENDLKEKQYLLAVSSMHPNKNFDLIIKTLEELANFNEQIVIAGGQNSKVFSNTFVKKNPNVKFVGYVTDEQLKSLYSKARAFIFPSYYEGFGLPPLEAMSLGCPVIASTAASIPEVCEEAALYFDPDSSVELKECISQIYEDDQIVEEMRNKGLQRKEAFSWEQTTKILLSELKKYK
ncbi:glycosyltransferase family 4 protein [Bacillus cereus]|uniref:glycosyltransferase family 4 protein n=1 Tax=Bacillus cereus TaxID=1396 RepID=UPI000BF7A44A|nr:glycosyltransferase family 1 protein [Bacillus cereus]PES17449.1 mannosyltransferase [Bacillus cereus]PGY64738.1 mannosyltransferase [Bacillus cereus]